MAGRICGPLPDTRCQGRGHTVRSMPTITDAPRRTTSPTVGSPTVPAPLPPATEYAIAAQGLVRRFGAFTAVDGVDLAIRAGEIYGFLGPNGAGKSTTVRVLCTLINLSGGQATVAGYDVATRPD